MIITCYNCNKRFDLESNLIPNKGRLLQCASCNHKWFFKKEILKKTVSPIDNDNINVFDQNNPINNTEITPLDSPSKEADINTEEEFDRKIVIDNKVQSGKIIVVKKNKKIPIKAKPIKNKKFKILNIFIIGFISFVAFIIIVDTFKYPIGKIVPNIEFKLYNLYESINDIILFIKDLI